MKSQAINSVPTAKTTSPGRRREGDDRDQEKKPFEHAAHRILDPPAEAFAIECHWRFLPLLWCGSARLKTSTIPDCPPQHPRS
jgi:hypothetical protein